MAQGPRESRDRRIAELEAQVEELRARLSDSETRQKELLEDGLRLSQENEVLRLEIAVLKNSRK